VLLCATAHPGQSGHDISDLGETLYTFLLRYGEEHDYSSQAVSSCGVRTCSGAKPARVLRGRGRLRAWSRWLRR
jgi:hypothetical protein